MGVFTLLLAGGAFLCSSSSPSFFATAASASAAAGPESKTYNLPSGGSLHIQVSRDVLPPTATTATSSSFSYGTPLSIPGATGSYGQYILTDNVEYRSGEVPILQQATGAAAAAATGGPSFLPSTFISSGAPLPTSQIIYGWVPDPDAATSSLASLNAAELNNALRSPAFVNKLRTRAMVEKSCNIPLAVDDRSYLESFYLSLIAERRFREREEEEKKEIEEELHQQQIAAANMNYARSAAARANIEKGKTGTGRGGEITGAEEEEEEEETAAALRYQETVDRIMSSRLEVLLTCKLAALLAQPNLFLNKNIQSIKLLELIAAALGVADNNSTDVLATANAAAAAATAATAGRSAPGGAAPSGVSATPMFGGIEPFLVASNPITTGHLLTLMIGYLERNSFFGPDARKPFYNFSTLIGGGGGEGGITMLDEMCSIDRGNPYKTSLLKRYRPKDKRGKTRKRGSNQPWFVRGIKRIHTNKQQQELVRVYCDATEMLLNAVMLHKDDMEQEMLSYSIPVEPLVDAATNAARIQIKTCRGGAANCLFNNSILNPLLNPLDVNNIIQNTKTREAFNFYTGLASAQIGNLLEDAGPRYYDIRAEQWVDALAKPAANTDILEKVFYFDTREMHAKKRSALVNIFEKFAKRIKAIEGKTSINIKDAVSIYNNIKTEVDKQRPKKWYKRRPPINKRNLFRIASILFLKSTLSCSLNRSFSLSFEDFTQFIFRQLKEKRRKKKEKNNLIKRSLMAFFRTGKGNTFYSLCGYDPLSLNYLFLYRFVTLGHDAGKAHDKQHALVKKTKISTKILGSKWTPNIIKRIMQGFKRNTLVQQAKQLLLESLDPSILPSLVNSFDFIVHTQAALQVNQNSFMYHDLGVYTAGKRKEEEEEYKLDEDGLVKKTDKQLNEWAEYGIPASLTRRLRKGGKLPKHISYDKIAIPDLTRWEKEINNKWLHALSAYLSHPYGAAAAAAGDPVALLVKESKERLEKEIDNTIFLGRVVQTPRESRIKKALNKINNLFRALIRSPRQNEYAVWIGVKINIDKVINIMHAVNNAAEVVKSTGIYNHIKEGFIEIVKEYIISNLDNNKRIINYDVYSSLNEEIYKKEGVYKSAYKRNHGFLSINPNYIYMNKEEKEKEFNYSMCMDHCESLWLLLTTLILNNIQNPNRLREYDEEMKKIDIINNINNPNKVNSFRIGLNIQTDYYENIIDKQSKENIKRMKYGGGTFFAYNLLLAGKINTSMGLINLGTSLIYQAPYYGNFIIQWIKEKKEARKKAIFSMLTLGFFFMYTFISITDITQHLADSGLGPAVDCLENLVIGPICPVDVIAPAITNAATTAVQDIFKVGILGILTPYLVLPMMLISIWQILKSEFNILLQFELNIKSLFKRFTQWVKQPFLNFWQKRKRIKQSIIKKATDKYNQEKNLLKGGLLGGKQAAEATEVPVSSFIGQTNIGNRDLDLLGIPSASSAQTTEINITWGAPVFPFSPPLIQQQTTFTP